MVVKVRRILLGLLLRAGDASISKPVRPKASRTKSEINKRPTASSRKQKEKRLSNAELNQLVKDNFVKETSRD